jgi:hypothetical protein
MLLLWISSLIFFGGALGKQKTDFTPIPNLSEEIHGKILSPCLS